MHGAKLVKKSIVYTGHYNKVSSFNAVLSKPICEGEDVTYPDAPAPLNSLQLEKMALITYPLL